MIVDIVRLDNFGRGICYINDKICFVKNAFPKEKVKIKIIKETSKYLEAIVDEIIKESKYRTNNKCIYGTICGGCVFDNYDYQKENEYKEEKVKSQVKNILKKDASIVKDIVYKNKENYRNKVILHGDKKEIGLYEESTHNIVKIDKCKLLSNKINEIIQILNKYKDIEEALIRTNNKEDEILLSLKTNNKELVNLKDKCDVLLINNEIKTEKKSITTQIKEKNYYLSSQSFFQINKELTKYLYDEVKEIVKENKPNKVLDLYCGTGSIGIYVSEHCKEIIGIDYNESNIKDANENKELNNIKNIEFICDRVENKITDFENIDLIIVDPPRNGLDNKTKEYLLKINSKKIIYVSCDLNTLIRDIKDLENNYTINYIKPFNMFPRTYHIECVTLLEKNN